MMPVSGTCVMSFSYEMIVDRWLVSSVLVSFRKHGAYGNHQAPNAVIIYRPGGYSLKSHKKAAFTRNVRSVKACTCTGRPFCSFPDRLDLPCRRWLLCSNYACDQGGLFTKGRKEQSHVRRRKPFAIDIARAIRLIHETCRKICVPSHVRLSMRRRIFIHLHC